MFRKRQQVYHTRYGVGKVYRKISKLPPTYRVKFGRRAYDILEKDLMAVRKIVAKEWDVVIPDKKEEPPKEPKFFVGETFKHRYFGWGYGSVIEIKQFPNNIMYNVDMLDLTYPNNITVKEEHMIKLY